MANRDNIDKAFNAGQKESEMYALWEKSNIFSPETYEKYILEKGRTPSKPFVMTLPPPNANGDLHVGHTCGYSFQDAMGRFARLHNRPTLLLSGKDHAGIQTETVYSKLLAKNGESKWDLGREEFYKRCYDFCISKATNAREQEKMIGLSADWNREKFTLDPALCDVIYETFFKLQEDGLVYRDKYIINQCPSCKTALADIDTVKKEMPGIFAYLIYPFKDEKDNDLAEIKLGYRGIKVATSRPETMLGDTAVAVNPDDPRYKEFIGKTLLLPLVNREIKIVPDVAVDIETGMGALKVTPAHASVDFEIAKNNNLDVINVIDESGKMTGPIPERFIGMQTVDCSKAVCAELKELGLLEKIERIKHEVPVCERCESVIEPIVSYQWFVNMKPLAEKAIEAIDSGETTIIPSGKQVALKKFLEDIRPWCISRQLWWGQKIPVWYSGGKELNNWLEDQIDSELGVWTDVSFEKKQEIKGRKLKEYEKATGKKLTGSGTIYFSIERPTIDNNWQYDQGSVIWESEEDVFDTWFSSGQWNYSTLGGVNGDDFKKYYPTSVMETMHDILFWWVARMIMLGIYKTGQTPFKHVYLHGMVLASDGQKMSKSKGNGVTPTDIISKYGADALRMWYYIDSLPATNTPLREEKIKGNRNFVNKIWNASRFVLMNIEDSEISKINEELVKLDKSEKEISLSVERQSVNVDRESFKFDNALELLVANKKMIDGYVESFRFNLAAEEIREFFWHTVCDKWIEEVKNLNLNLEIGSSSRIKNISRLFYIVKSYIKVMHPYMPFVTEAVWQEFVKLGLAENIVAAEEI